MSVQYVQPAQISEPNSAFPKLAPTHNQLVVSVILIALAALTAIPAWAAGRHGHITISGSLPSATLQAPYSAVLAVSGGSAPYSFSISSGKLPTGLALDQATGSISGVPLTAGNFNFTLLVSDPKADQGDKRLTLTVSSTPPAGISVTISPTSATVASGASQPFTASVRGTSQTAVNWSASAGKVSTGGLFTAPNVSAITGVTVTATSVADSTQSASATVSVTPPGPPPPVNPTITTSSIPSATVAVAYSTALTATGGKTPYQWSVASGSLAPGIQLQSSTGAISGSSSSSGSFSFTAQVKDNSGQSAQHSFTLLVSPSAPSGSCGPPAYNCSRTDVIPAPQLGSVPDVGNLTGANTVVTDPDFHSRIVRVTDATTAGSATLVTASSGSADVNLFNIDSTRFSVQDTGATSYVFDFNPSTMQATRIPGFSFGGGSFWSRTNRNILYNYAKATATLGKYDFTTTNNPSFQTVYDFTSSPNCLPAGFKRTWISVGGGGGADTVFAAAFSNAGTQGSGIFIVAYTVGKGCRMWNTQTGQVTGDWGPTGAIGTSLRFTLHNVKISKDGNWLAIDCKQTLKTCGGPIFWNIPTLTVTTCSAGGSCSGHWTEGMTTWENNNNSPLGSHKVRSFANPAISTSLIHSYQPGMQGPLDQHQSWNNVDVNDTYPVFSTTWSNLNPLPAAWYNEIIALSPVHGTVWRFAHSFITTKSQRFSTQNGIGSVSQDGRFFLLSSDWMGTLGSESGASTCTIGTNCRGDVFVIELK